MRFDLFSKRLKRGNGEMPDVYRYDKLPDKLKNQIVLLLISFFVDSVQSHAYIGKIVTILRHENGVFNLCGSYPDILLTLNSNYSMELYQYFLKEQDIAKCIDVIEVSFSFIESIAKSWEPHEWDIKPKIDGHDAIDTLNSRFKEHNIGYQYVKRSDNSH